MLSPHEMAALMLIETNPYPNNLDPEDLDTLCGRQLVALEGLASGCAHVHLTVQGRSVLRAIGRLC